MSLPKFPDINSSLKIRDSLSMILASIAMEELGLSNIINAESEKLRYVLKDKGCDKRTSVEEVLAVNKSIKSLLDSIMQNQVILKGKMESAIDALDYDNCCVTGPTGPQGPTGSRGATGATGPRGADGALGHNNCAISFLGCPDQRWTAGKSLVWSSSNCSSCCSLYLSSDRQKIIMGSCGCYVVSFSIDLQVTERSCKYAAVSLQTTDLHKKIDKFICHFPIAYTDAPFTASASGIFIPTQNYSTELVLTLMSPDSVTVKQSSICVMEI